MLKFLQLNTTIMITIISIGIIITEGFNVA